MLGVFILSHRTPRPGDMSITLSDTEIGKLLSDIEHIKQTLGEMNKKLDEINGNLDANITDVAVLKDWRKSHDDRHGWGNSALSVIVAAVAAYLGVNK